ncbi:hypothetical protein K458DRAFT_448697 [Lentithecium fluviatile CBS 122367]|uniref:non-specific serine/threonine protein kinase n=1 Tax=Lentithecium fluviatile CBS 122367 TaxID=1168545 RepID=A0A6G1JP42_9PLEO|nr:hypothetical protein K458DRAFT_448697 [Lentithecium fluviatile CBS 122367]
MVTTPYSSSAKPITPPSQHERKLYSLRWLGNIKFPCLAEFPNLRPGEVSLVEESPDTTSLRRSSVLVDFSSHACIQRVDSEPYPIIKLAHPDAQSMTLIRYEYAMLSRLAQLDLPIPVCSNDPIIERGQLRGYRMEELFKLAHDVMPLRLEDVKQAVKKFHEAGYSHRDLSLSNIMKDSQESIVVIDVSCSGPVGKEIPSWVPNWAYERATFHTESDIKQMEDIFP